MAPHSDTLVIIPAYNEERAIASVISNVKKRYPDIDIAVVNDGSSDQTAELAEKAGAIVLSHPFNIGYGVSVQTGYKYALSNYYKFVVQLDGDGQHDPEGVDALLKNLKDGSCDIVLGSRFGPSYKYRTSMYRFIGVNFFRALLRLLSGQNINDPTTGFQAMNKKVLILFSQDVFPYDYPDADVIILLSKLHFRIKEVPVLMYPNPEGKSMHKGFFNASYYIFKMVLSMFVTKMRYYKIPDGMML